MKKFIKILLCLCLCVVSIGFVACGKESKIDAPATNALVSSNGGVVVRKGDYLYFANGYNSYEDVGKSDLDKSYNLGGLFVTKLNSDGEIEYTDSKELKNMTKLSGKLASFEATELFVSGDYMYFTTINTEETKKGALQTSHLEVYRIKLDSTDCKRVYRSYTDFENSNGDRVVTFKYFENDGKVYLLINENGTLKRVVCGGGIGDVTDIKSGVKSLVYSDGENVFFTTVEDDFYTISRYNIFTNKVTKKLHVESKDDVINSLFEVKFNNLYFKATMKNTSAEYLYSISLDAIESGEFSKYKKLTATSYSSIYLLSSEADGILLMSSSKVEIADSAKPLDKGSLVEKENMNASGTVIMVRNGFVYYYADKTISRWDYSSDESETIVKDSNMLTYHFDVLDNYLYYYATSGDNQYLYRVNIADRAEENVPQLVGKYNEGDAPTTEE